MNLSWHHTDSDIWEVEGGKAPNGRRGVILRRKDGDKLSEVVFTPDEAEFLAVFLQNKAKEAREMDEEVPAANIQAELKNEPEDAAQEFIESMMVDDKTLDLDLVKRQFITAGVILLEKCPGTKAAVTMDHQHRAFKATLEDEIIADGSLEDTPVGHA